MRAGLAPETKERLALVLEGIGQPGMAAEARRGRYDDFESDSATPIMDLVRDLHAVGHHDIARRAIEGEWDATSEEADAWARSEDGENTFDLRGGLGDGSRAARD